MFIKVCGLKSFEEIDAAVKLGYSAIGIVLHPGSPRFCHIEKAKKLAGYAKGSGDSENMGNTDHSVKDLLTDSS